MTSFYVLSHLILLILCLQAGQASRSRKRECINSFFDDNPANNLATDDVGNPDRHFSKDAANATPPSGRRDAWGNGLSQNAKLSDSETTGNEQADEQDLVVDANDQDTVDNSIYDEIPASQEALKTDPTEFLSPESSTGENAASENAHCATDSSPAANRALDSPDFPPDSSPLLKKSPSTDDVEWGTASEDEISVEDATENAVKDILADRASGGNDVVETSSGMAMFPTLSPASSTPTTGSESLAHQRPLSPFSSPSTSPSSTSLTPVLPSPISTAPIKPITLYNPLTAVDRKVTAISFYAVFGFCCVCFFTIIVAFVYTSFTGSSAAINGVAKVAGVTSVSLTSSSLTSIMEAGLSQPSTPGSDAAMMSAGPLDLSQIDLI